MTVPPCLSFVIDDRVITFRPSFAVSLGFQSWTKCPGNVATPSPQGMFNLDGNTRRPPDWNRRNEVFQWSGTRWRLVDPFRLVVLVVIQLLGIEHADELQVSL
jgi:hypothetical protein